MRINKHVPVETFNSTEVVVVRFHAVLGISTGQELVGFRQINIQRHDIGYISFELLVSSRKKDNSIEQISDENPCTGTYISELQKTGGFTRNKVDRYTDRFVPGNFS